MVSASHASVASRVVNPTHDELRPTVSASCVSFASELSTACVRVASQDEMGMEKSATM